MEKAYLFVILMLFTCTISAQSGLISYDTGPSYEGYTLFPSADMVYLIDNCGKLIHEWSCGNNASLSTYLMENGNLLFMSKLAVNNTFVGGGGGGGRLEIYAPDNSLVWQYDHYVADLYCAHHDVEPLPNGNILVITWLNIPFTTAIAEGRDPNLLPNSSKLWVEKIVELQPIGANSANIVWEWSIMDHLIQEYNPNRNNYGVVADNPQLLNFNAADPTQDWIHFNGIDYNATLDQILLSSRHLNEIFIIDHSTTTAEAAGHTGGNYGKGGDFLYRYGNPQNYNRGNATNKVLFYQHDARWIEAGYSSFGDISIFNNGVGRPNGSRSTADIISLPTNSFGGYISLASGQAYPPNTPSMEYDLGPASTGDSFYSGNQGGVQVLPNGNILVCNANNANYFEIDENNQQIFWEYDNPENGSTFKVTRYSAAYPGLQYFDLSPMGTLESPPSSASNLCNVVYDCNLTANFSGLPTVTSSSAPITLTGTPAGGTFSGLGIVFSAFNPSIAGPGIHLISYTYTDQNNCTATETKTILVFSIVYNFVNYNLGIVSPKIGNLQTELNFKEDGQYQFEIMSIDGRVLHQQKVEARNFQLNGNLQLPALNSGTYLMRIYNKKHQMIEKFVVGN